MWFCLSKPYSEFFGTVKFFGIFCDQLFEGFAEDVGVAQHGNAENNVKDQADVQAVDADVNQILAHSRRLATMLIQLVLLHKINPEQGQRTHPTKHRHSRRKSKANQKSVQSISVCPRHIIIARQHLFQIISLICFFVRKSVSKSTLLLPCVDLDSRELDHSAIKEIEKQGNGDFDSNLVVPLMLEIVEGHDVREFRVLYGSEVVFSEDFEELGGVD